MDVFIDIMKLLAGVGLFLFAMYLIEESLRNLSGRRLKLFLQRITKNNIGAVSGGALVTGILQSSSMVSLMVLAFVSAGVFTLKNALAIILGANLGTTLDSWMVATLGFKTNIEAIAYPAVFIGGLLLILLGKRKLFKYFAYFLFGFGLLFIGLSFIKTAMEDQVTNLNLAKFTDMPLAIFLLIGFLITLLVQSSSVTMAITLSAVHTGVIDFPSAAAIVLGSETGTTIKIFLSGISGTASKKRVVLGNFLFNVILTILAFIFIKPILSLITNVLGISSPLIGLVSFSTFVNLISILLFLPFLNQFVSFLEKFYKKTDASAAAFIGQAKLDKPTDAIQLFKRETAYFLYNCMLLNLEQLSIKNTLIEKNHDLELANDRKKIQLKTSDEKYDFLKHLQGELQSFYLELNSKANEHQKIELHQLATAIRSAMHAVKMLKDIKNNISNLANSSKDIKFNLYLKLKVQSGAMYSSLNTVLNNRGAGNYKELATIFNEIENNFNETLKAFYISMQNTKLESSDITTAIAFNRGLFTSHKAMVMAAKDFLLEEKEARSFNKIPNYST